MTIIELKEIPRVYKIAGQHAEQKARFTLTGEIKKADNIPFTVGGDCLDIQIKSARATICKGVDIRNHIAHDGAKRYGYVVADFSVMYLMTATEYFDFATTFATVTTESEKNGGAVKTRFKSEGKAMRAWLMARV